MQKIQLSKNFYLHEFIRSQVATRHDIEIKVEPESETFANLQRLCVNILQPLREALGPVHITSGYRPLAVNILVGGSNSSLHLNGLAADIVVTGHTPLEVCQWLENSGLHYDQVIHEFGRWTHVAAPFMGHKPRYQLLTAYRDHRVTKYDTGIRAIRRQAA